MFFQRVRKSLRMFRLREGRFSRVCKLQKLEDLQLRLDWLLSNGVGDEVGRSFLCEEYTLI